MNRNYEIKVLDHGYVKFIDSMGTDETIVEAARMSTGRGFVSWDKYRRCKRCDYIEYSPDYDVDHGLCSPETAFPSVPHDWQDFPRGDLGLLDTLYKNGHSTPFEMCELAVEVQAPIMVFREWHRHRTQSYSEFSARYAQMPDLHYVPSVERIAKQSAANRQGSAEPFNPEHAASIVDRLTTEQSTVYRHYDEMCDDGVAREVARINTPVSRYSKMRAKTDLRNWLAFLTLRLHPTAQWEIRQYAQAVAEMVKALWPKTWALFEEYTLHSVRLSRTEIKETLRAILSGPLADAERSKIVEKLWSVL